MASASAEQPLAAAAAAAASPPSVPSTILSPFPAPPAPPAASAPPSLYHTRTWVVSPSAPAAALEAELAEAAALLREGELVGFPTETVYGLGGSQTQDGTRGKKRGARGRARAHTAPACVSVSLCADALSSSALSGIYVAKGRPSDNPLIVHVHSHEQFLSLGRDIPQLALRLAERFWPGPLTLIVPTARGAGAASDAARAGLDCVGVRMPNHPVALALLRACGVPLAAPSANLSGRPSPTTAAHVAADLSGRIAGIVDGGAAEGVGLESTVVECTDDESLGWRVTILRPGGVTREMLEEVAGKGRVRLDPALTEAMPIATAEYVQALPKQSARRGAERADMAALLGSPSAASSPSASAAASPSPSPSPVTPASSVSSPGPKAPGMKYTHYAPRAPLLLVEGPLALLLDTADSYLSQPGGTTHCLGIMCTEENRAAIDAWRVQRGYVGGSGPSARHVELVVVGARSDLASVARGLYGALRAFDESAVQIIVSESFPSEGGGIGEALMNRLHKAAGGRIVRQAEADSEVEQLSSPPDGAARAHA